MLCSKPLPEGWRGGLPDGTKVNMSREFLSVTSSTGAMGLDWKKVTQS